MKWEDKLLGRKFTLVTDHKGLEYFKTQPILSPRQVRWWEYLSRFNYDTIHVDGDRNRVADALSRYYKYDTVEGKHPDKEFVKADEILIVIREVSAYMQLCSPRDDRSSAKGPWLSGGAYMLIILSIPIVIMFISLLVLS